MPNPSESPAKQKLQNPQDVPVTNPNNVKSVYANFFGVNATMTDFTITFFQLGQTPGGGKPTNEVQAVVTLPMAAVEGLQQVLKQLAVQTADAIKQAEKMMKASG